MLYMDSNWFSPCIVLFIFLSIRVTHVQSQISSFKVSDFGASPDGGRDNQQAFVSAWKKACGTDGGVLEIPQGTFLLSGAEFPGPCNGQTKVLVNGIVKAPPNVLDDNLDYWIVFRKINGLSISGNGTFDGDGAKYWTLEKRAFVASLDFQSVTSATIQGIRSINSKMFHISVNECQDVTFNEVDIRAPAESPNTDGIHIARSNDVRITNAHIATGDDCISLGDGSTNINITAVACGPGHGISIGSLGKYQAEKEVRLVTVTNCTFANTDNGLRIKTWAAPSTPNVASGITFAHIRMNNVQNPIIIDQHYCPDDNCRDGESNVAINNVKFIDVRGSSGTEIGVKISCSKSKPCEGVELSDVDLRFKGQLTTASCSSADVKFLGTDQVPSRCSLDQDRD